ncbi:MAG: hypothetical protein JWP18_1284 [Solirubrobacterales bacterium]|jgi:hypothetical protein|nr:hypothetical protein [Solirubrobacterales bacterium]
MTSQLRIYRIKPGEMDDFVDLWREHIVPARLAYGFTLAGAWTTQDGEEFAWVVDHDGPEGFEAADKRYYDSPERAALPRNPAEFIEDMELRLMEPVGD